MTDYNKESQKKSTNEPIELKLASLLRVGAFISALLIAIGISSMLLGNDMLASKLITAGLLALMATPVLRVVTAGTIFIREKDWRFAMFCLIVFLALTAGALLGRIHA